MKSHIDYRSPFGCLLPVGVSALFVSAVIVILASCADPPLSPAPTPDSPCGVSYVVCRTGDVVTGCCDEGTVCCDGTTCPAETCEDVAGPLGRKRVRLQWMPAP